MPTPMLEFPGKPFSAGGRLLLPTDCRGTLSLSIAALAILLSSGCSDSGSGEKTTGKTGSSNFEKASDPVSGSHTAADSVADAGKENVTANDAALGGEGMDSKSDSDVESEKAPADSPKKIVVSTEPDINNPEFHDKLLEVLDGYLLYGMVNSIALPAPTDCKADGLDEPKPMISESEHEASHGNKLYFLFAKKIGHYVSPGGTPAPVGQAVVKESWTSSPANPAARNLINHASGNRVNPRVKVGNETLEIGQRKSFFIMTKLAQDTPDTDQGWVYGVIDADSKKVLASGKIASCMSCHVEAENDRLFGSKHVIGLEETTVRVESPAEEMSNEEASIEGASKEDQSRGSSTKAQPMSNARSGAGTSDDPGK